MHTSACRPIGFIDHARDALYAARPRSNAHALQHETPNTLLQLDGGERVSFLDGSHNLMVLGTTGSGKTASILLPAFDRLCAAGCGGIAVDSKGSLAPLLLAVARRHGREADVLEIGPYEGAARLNLLAGRNRAEAAAILEPLLLGYCAHDTERFWRMTGFEQFMDAYEITAALCRRAGVPVGLHVPARMLNDSAYALACYERFKNGASSPAERDLATRIGDTGAHIVPCSKKRMEERVWREQTTYYASAIRTGMAMVRVAPGIVANFFAADGEASATSTWVFDQMRIVILRLSPDSGETGAGLARLLQRDFYSAVFARGKRLWPGQYVFALADELQDYVSTDHVDALNDSAFLAKCREFHCIFLGGTQSAIALSQRAVGGLADVRAMLNNCNTRIFFYCDDPETQRLASIASEDGMLHELGSGECILAHYDAVTRRHEAGVTSADAMYKVLRPVLDAASPAEDWTAVPAPDTADRERDCQSRLVSAPEVKLVPAPAAGCGEVVEVVEEGPREAALAMVQHSGRELQYVPEAHRTPEVCMAAVTNDARALHWVPEALKSPELCLAAVRKGDWALEFVPERLRTQGLCLMAVRQDGLLLDLVPASLRTPKLCHEAVMQDGRALEAVPEEAKTPEICLEAVRRSSDVASFLPATPAPAPSPARHDRAGAGSGRSGGSRLAGFPCRPPRRRTGRRP